jgi:predicted ribosome-associated RNA-binding protein Tma20
MKTKEERLNRIVARGEVSGHSHIITGDAVVVREKEKTIVHINGKCAIKHLLEKPFVDEGIEQWTKEHHDADISKLIKKAKEGEVFIRHGDIFIEKIDDKTCLIIQQNEYNPYLQAIQKVQD